MLTGWYFVNLVWICRFVEVREFYFLKFSPKCAQELTLAQGSVCFLISAVSLSSLPISTGSKAAAVPAVPGQGGQGITSSLFAQALMLHVGVLQQPHMGKNEPEDLSSFDQFVCSRFLLYLLEGVGGVFRWELTILEAAVIERKLQDIKSMFLLNWASNGMMFSRLVIPLSSSDPKLSETGPVPWTLCSHQWGPHRVNFGIATEYNLRASLSWTSVELCFGDDLGFLFVFNEGASLKACPPCLLISPPQMLLDRVCAMTC